MKLFYVEVGSIVCILVIVLKDLHINLVSPFYFRFILFDFGLYVDSVLILQVQGVRVCVHLDHASHLNL